MEKKELPEGWKWVKLGDVCKTTSGGTPNRKYPNYYKGNIPWIKSGELNKGVITKSEEFISEEALVNSSAKIFPKGTLLIALYGATIGKSAFLGIEAATNQAICGIYENENIDSRFLFYYLEEKKHFLIGQAIGGAQPNISQTILKNLNLPLPNVTVQRKVVGKIEELFSVLEKGVENLRLAQQQFKTYRQAVLKWAFEGKLTNENLEEAELPEGWMTGKLKDHVSILGDGLHGTPKYDLNGDYFFVNGNNLQNGKIVFKETTKRVGKEEYEKYKKTLDETTILVSINGTLGNVAFYNSEKIILGKSACYFNLLPTIDKMYMRYILMTTRFLNYANQTATGSTIPNVSLKSMREFTLPIPSIAEQHKVVEAIEWRFSVLVKVEEIIAEDLQRAEILRQSILKKGFEGKLMSDQNFIKEAIGKIKSQNVENV